MKGLLRAASRSKLVVSPLGEEAFRVGEATVHLREGLATCDCPMGDAPACLHRTLALGGTNLETAEPSMTASVRAPRERLPVEDLARFSPLLAEIDALLAAMLTMGLRRAARVCLHKTRTLAAKAAAMKPRPRAPREAGLGRIARSLDRLAVLLPSIGGANAGASEGRALAEMAVLRNLGRAIRANMAALPLVDFAGALRSEYVEVPTLEVQGLGLEAWLDPAGNAGLTAYVAVIGGDRMVSRVLSRTTLMRFTPGQTIPPTWIESLASGPAFARSGATMRDLSRGRFVLSGARVAYATCRLSGSGATNASVESPLSPDDARLAPFVLQNLQDALRLGKALAFDPLGRPPPSLPIVLLPIASLSPSDFDPATQRLTMRLGLVGGASLATSLSFREDRSRFFDNLEVLSRAVIQPRWLCARLVREEGELVIEPITAVFSLLGPRDLDIDVLGREIEEKAP